MENLKKQMNFLIEIDKMKNVFRQTLIYDKSRNENDAEHSWHLAMYATVLSDYAPEGTNMTKVLKMALIHDIVEIYAGDTFLYDEELNKSKAKREKESAEKIYSILPIEQGEELKSFWEEFERGETKEAIFCSILDRIQPIVLNYITEGGTWKKYNVKKDMVLEKSSIILKDADVRLKNFLLEIIEDSVRKGYLLP